MEPERRLAEIDQRLTDGLFLRPTYFSPTFDKWTRQVCGGLQLHVVDRQRFCPYLASLEILRAVMKLYGDRFSWLPPPYEYEYEKLPFDILTGDERLRQALENGEDILALRESWLPELEDFCRRRREFLLY